MKHFTQINLNILIIILFPFLSFCQIEEPTIQLKELEGSWYINYSNFPMWLKGHKTSPSFNYTLLNKNSFSYLIDEVKFTKKGKSKSIHGIDTPLNTSNSFFEWRGKGLLKVLKSKWRIIHFDTQNSYAIIFFEKTLFTPAGYDIISRSEKISLALKSTIKQKLIAYNIDEELVEINHH